MTVEYRVVDENGDEFLRPSTLQTFARRANMTVRRFAELEAARLNENENGQFRVERVRQTS